MAKKIIKKSPVKSKSAPLVIEKGIPVIGIFGRSPVIAYAEEYALVDKMQKGESIAFNTEEQTSMINAIRYAIQKTSPKKRFVVKKVDKNTSRIWRTDVIKKSKWTNKKGEAESDT